MKAPKGLSLKIPELFPRRFMSKKILIALMMLLPIAAIAQKKK